MAIKGPGSTSDRQRREEGVRDFFNEKRDERITTYQLESFDVVFPNGLQDQNIVNITVVHSDSNDFSEKVPLKFVYVDKEQNTVEREFVYLFKRNAIIDPSLPEEKDEELSENEQQELIRRLIDGKFTVEGELISFLKAKIGKLLPEGANFAEIALVEGKKSLIIEIQPEGVGLTRAFKYSDDKEKFEELFVASPQAPTSRKGRWIMAGIVAGTVAAVALIGKDREQGSPTKVTPSASEAQPSSSTPALPGSPSVTTSAAVPSSEVAVVASDEAPVTTPATVSTEVEPPAAPIDTTEESPAADVAAPVSSANPAPEPSPAAEETTTRAREELESELQERLVRLKAEVGQFLNAQGLTAAQCDEALESWAQAEGNAEQAQMTEQWKALKALIVLQTEINGSLDQIMSTAGSAEPLEALEELLNPNNLSVEQIDASIAEWEKPEFADHPESAETLRRWRVWRFLVQFLEVEVRPFYERVQELH